MKQCPSCRKTYGDDLYFCLDHGLPLVEIPPVDPNALTDINLEIRSDGNTERLVVPVAKTEVLPKELTRSNAPGETPKPRSSPLPYVLIGVLLLVCAALAAALVFSNRDRLFTSTVANSSGPEVLATPVKPPPTQTRSSPTPSPVTPTPAKTAPPPTANSIRGDWRGDWKTDSGTLFNFDLTLDESSDNNIEGRVRWTMRRTARADKTDKVGLSAIEYVRGNYNEETGSLYLKGYRKDDPDGVLVMLDEYKLEMSANGQKLLGVARNGGKWNGKVDLTRSGPAAR